MRMPQTGTLNNPCWALFALYVYCGRVSLWPKIFLTSSILYSSLSFLLCFPSALGGMSSSPERGAAACQPEVGAAYFCLPYQTYLRTHSPCAPTFFGWRSADGPLRVSFVSFEYIYAPLRYSFEPENAILISTEMLTLACLMGHRNGHKCNLGHRSVYLVVLPPVI